MTLLPPSASSFAPPPPTAGSIRLQESFPHATTAECDRFDKAFQRDASSHLAAYLDWRSEHGLDNENNEYGGDDDGESSGGGVGVVLDLGHHAGSDELHWVEATDRAMAYINKASSENNNKNKKMCKKTKTDDAIDSLDNNSLSSSPLVRFVRCHWVETVGSYLKDKTGHRILHLLPAQISLQNGATNMIESYVLALSFYLERQLQRDSDEQLTLLLDARAGRGWPNLPAWQMITFVRRVSTVLSQHFPCRLHKCIVYPIPRAALVIWHFVQAFLSPSLRQFMVLIAGSATDIESPLPHALLEEYVPYEGIALLEDARRESFS
jgi:CRAL/TRIO domain